MKKICLDAGHYGKVNVCPAIPEYYESERMWDLHLLLKKKLEAYGFEVITTRTDQTADMALTQRGRTAAGCDLFISMHSNATGTYVMNEDIDSPMAYVALNGSADDIAQRLVDCVEAVIGTKEQGYITTKRYGDTPEESKLDYYGVIRGAVSVGTPALLLEHSFHTNERVVRWLLDDKNLDKLAQAEAEVIAEYFGVLPEEIPTSIEKLDGSLKVIYTGADGVNVHNTPDFEEASVNYNYGPVGPATAHGSEFTVTGIATLGDGSTMYRLLSGLYITANPKYVEFTPAEKPYEPWAAKVVNAEALNVRETPNGEVIDQLQAVVVIGEEPDSDGDLWYKVRCGGLTGYVWPEYVSK